MVEMGTCVRCGNEVKVTARRCPRCHQPFQRTATVSAGGRRPPTRSLHLVMRIAPVGTALDDAETIPLVEGIPTLVGREAPGAVGRVMDANAKLFEDVSRDHLVLIARGRQVEVEDRSTLGTFVNGSKLPYRTPKPLLAPVTLRLASGCIVDIQLEPQQ